MTGEVSQADWLALLPEAAAVVSIDGRIVEVNDAFQELVAPRDPRGALLSDVVAVESGDLTARLRAWARTKQLTPGRLVLRARRVNGELAVQAGRLSPPGADAPLILVRCRPKGTAAERFHLLNEKIDALSHQVLARQRAEQEARDERERFRTTLTSIGDGVITTDASGRIAFMNPVAERLTGWSIANAEGRASPEVFKIVNEQSRKRVESPIARVIRDGLTVGLANHTILIARDGTEHPIDDSGAPIRDADGRLAGVVLVFRDISDRRRREADLHRSHALLHAVVEGTTDAVFVKDLRGRYLTINSAGARMLDKLADEVIGLEDAALFPAEVARELTAHDRRIIEAGAAGTFEETLDLPGGPRAMLTTKAPYRDERGEIIGVIGIARDVTARERVEQALRESERRFRSMADSAPVLIAMSDATGGWTYFNRQWLEFTGRKLEQEVGEGWTRGIHPDDRERMIDAYLRAFEAREPFTIEFRLGRHDGEHRWMLSRGQPRYTPDGSFVGYIGTCVDITERQRAEQQLLSINETLEQRVEERTAQLRELAQQLTRAEQKERRRLAQTLHDHLQQLLVAARMRTDLMARRLKDRNAAETLGQVQDLIGQSIDASRSLTLELSPPVLYDGGLCAALPWLARRMEEQHALRVAVHAETEAEPRDEETRIALFLAVRELLFNTVKHAGTDRATVGLSLSERGRVRLLVEDRGVGFDPAAAVAVAAGAGERGGFGLFNLRERIEFLGGRLDIAGAPGEGTTVEIEVPLRAAPAGATAGARGGRWPVPPLASPAEPAGEAIRVLLADDHRILREGIAGILAEHADLRVVAEAADGREAVELARLHKPDVVVMDVTMPNLNGIEATRLIGEQAPGVAVVGLSMHDSEDMARAMIDAGAFCLLVKDGPADALVSTIRAAASRARR